MKNTIHNGAEYALIDLPKPGETILVPTLDGWKELEVEGYALGAVVADGHLWHIDKVLRRVEPKPEQPRTTYASAPNIIETKAPVLEGPADMSRQDALEARIEALEISMDRFEAGQGRFVRFVRNELVKAGLLKQDGEPMVAPDAAPSKTPAPKQDPSDERMREMFNGTLSKTFRMWLGESAPEPSGWEAFMIYGYKLWICVSDIERRLNEARSKAYQEASTTEPE